MFILWLCQYLTILIIKETITFLRITYLDFLFVFLFYTLFSILL